MYENAVNALMGEICDECGKEIPLNAPEGLCPNCLISMAAGNIGNSDTDDLEVDSEIGIGRLHYFGDYELLSEIARGGMGIVYRARQISLNRVVAVKVLLFGKFSSDDYVKQFEIEAQAAASLQHPNIMAIHEIGEHEGQRYFSMDYVEGSDLATLVRDGPLTCKRAGNYMKTIARAVQYAHERGILHRDLKPSNILIDHLDQPRVTDFGLAKRLGGDSGAISTGRALGSPNYMPPEQIEPRRGRTSFGSDIYSLGAILYHLLTGRPPFMAATLEETLLQSLNMDAIPVRLLNPGVPRDLETICLKCLEKDPMRRYRSASDLAEDLENWLSGRVIMARPSSAFERTWRWAKRNSSMAALVDSVSRKNRPMAGIITAIIMNSITIILDSSKLFRLMVARHIGEKPGFYKVFPEIEGVLILHLSMWIICSGVMIVGALMSQVCHPMGNRTVRAAAWALAFVQIVIPAYMAQIAANSLHWQFLGPHERTMLLISFYGGAAGGLLRAWIFLFLFRKSKWP